MVTVLADSATAAAWTEATATVVGAIGAIGALWALLVSNRRVRISTERQLELARQALDDERVARREEIARINAERRDTQAAQARQINREIAAPAGGVRGSHLLIAAFEVLNESDKRIYNVTGELLHRRDPAGPLTPFTKVIVDLIDRIPTGQHETLVFTAAPESVAALLPAKQWEPELFEIDLLFTDANGLRWRRRGQEQPERLVPQGTDHTATG